DHLKPDGMIAITRWEFSEPREALRVVSEGMTALRQMGLGDVRRNFIVVSNGKLNQDGHPVLVLVKKSAFTDEEVIRYRQHLIAEGSLQELYSPWFRRDNDLVVPADLIWARPDWYAFGGLIESPDPASFIAHYPYNVAPVSDNAPFFFFTFKTSQLFHQILHPGAQ